MVIDGGGRIAKVNPHSVVVESITGACALRTSTPIVSVAEARKHGWPEVVGSKVYT